MFIKQISVFLENKRGSFRMLTELLGKNGIDLLAVSIADTKNFGIVRCVVRATECDKALELLKGADYSTRVNNVICVAVPDRPCGLAEVLALLDDNDLFIEYTYSFVRGRFLFQYRPQLVPNPVVVNSIKLNVDTVLSRRDVF